MSENKKIDVTTKIEDIQLLDFHFTESMSKKKINIESLIYDSAVNIKIHQKDKKVSIKYICTLFTEKEKLNEVCSIMSSSEFQLVNMDEIINSNGGVPKQVLSLFLSIIIGATRGFLIMRVKGTSIEGAIIPLIDPNSFFPKSTEDIKQ